MLAAHYLTLLHIHVGSVAVSGSLFAIRGILHVAGFRFVNHWVLRIAAILIDTTLLVSAILLTIVVHQYPFVQGWLTTKVVLLLVYIVIGYIALKRTRTPRGRATALLLALAVFAYIIGVAIRHNSAGWFT